MTTQITRRTMMKQALGATLGGAAVATGFGIKDTVAQRPSLGGLDVTGVVTDLATMVETPFEGVLSGLTATLDRANGVIDIAGTISGVPGAVEETVSFVTSITQNNLDGTSCDILNLDLGPLDLNVLGLQIDLAPVVLDITAVPGDGNLLGNLLCAIAGLLDRGGPLAGLTGLLNNLFRSIG